jgi:hypothetical protein
MIPVDLPSASVSRNRIIPRLQTRPIVVCLQGPSLARLAPALESFDRADAMYCCINDRGVVEKHLSLRVGRGVDVWFMSSEAEFHRLRSTVPAFLERAPANLFVTLSTTMAHIDAELALALAAQPALTERILLADAAIARVFDVCQSAPINSMTVLLATLVLLRARGPVFLLGCDGVPTSVAAYEAYDSPEQLAPHRLSSCSLYEDMQAFHENWPRLVAWFERELGLPVPKIWNCNPESHYTVFERIRWQDVFEPDGILAPGCVPAAMRQPDASTRLLPQPAGWPAVDASMVRSALGGFAREERANHPWRQRAPALEPYCGWPIAAWGEHFVALRPEAAPREASAATWSDLQAWRVAGDCLVWNNLAELKLQVAEAVMADLRGWEARALQAEQEREARALHAEQGRDMAIWAVGRARIDRIIFESQLKDLDVALYPAGGHTRELLSSTALGALPTLRLVDASPQSWGTHIAGRLVESPDALRARRPDMVVICSRTFEDAIYGELQWLRALGVRTVRLYCPDAAGD